MLYHRTDIVDLGKRLELKSIDIDGKPANTVKLDNYGQQLSIYINEEIHLYTQNGKLWVNYVIRRPNHDHDDSQTKEICDLRTVVQY